MPGIEVIGAGLGRTGTKSLQVRVLHLVGRDAFRTLQTWADASHSVTMWLHSATL